MKTLIISVLLLTTTLFSSAQCNPNRWDGYVLISPGLIHAPRGTIGTSGEIGIIFPESSFIYSFKAACWVDHDKITYQENGVKRTVNIDRAVGVYGMKLYYAPDAYTGKPDRFIYGTGLDLVSKEMKGTLPALDGSVAYLIRLSPQDRSDTYLRVELGTLLTPTYIQPTISINFFALL